VVVPGGECVGGLETVAGDAEDSRLVASNAAVGIEARRDSGGDAAGSLREDALRLGEFLDAGDDFDV